MLFLIVKLLMMTTPAEAQNAKINFVPISRRAVTNYNTIALQDAPVAYWRLSTAATEANLGSGGALPATLGTNAGDTECFEDTATLNGCSPNTDNGGRDIKPTAAALPFTRDTSNSSSFARVGAYNQCATFAGASGDTCSGLETMFCYKIGDNALVEPAANFTLEAWVSPSNPTTTAQYIINKFNSGAPNKGYYIRAVEVGGVDVFQFAVGTGAASTQVQSTAQTMNSTNVFHIVAIITNDPSSQLRLYINGQLNNSVAFGTPDATGTEQFIIGSGTNATNCIEANAFIGKIKEVAVYNKALSIERIKLHYNSGVGL